MHKYVIHRGIVRQLLLDLNHEEINEILKRVHSIRRGEFYGWYDALAKNPDSVLYSVIIREESQPQNKSEECIAIKNNHKASCMDEYNLNEIDIKEIPVSEILHLILIHEDHSYKIIFRPL